MLLPPLLLLLLLLLPGARALDVSIHISPDWQCQTCGQHNQL
jgi:hypothetical protein